MARLKFVDTSVVAYAGIYVHKLTFLNFIIRFLIETQLTLNL